MNRIQTFKLDWPHKFIKPYQLARAGFYFIGSPDNVQCYFCNIKLNGWKFTDNAESEHYRLSPTCSFLRNHRITNNESAYLPEFLDNLFYSIIYKNYAISKFEYNVYVNINTLDVGYYTIDNFVGIETFDSVRIDLKQEKVFIIIKLAENEYLRYKKMINQFKHSTTAYGKKSKKIMKISHNFISNCYSFIFYDTENNSLDCYESKFISNYRNMKIGIYQVLLISNVKINNEDKIQIHVPSKHFILPNRHYQGNIETIKAWNKTRTCVIIKKTKYESNDIQFEFIAEEQSVLPESVFKLEINFFQ